MRLWLTIIFSLVFVQGLVAAEESEKWVFDYAQMCYSESSELKALNNLRRGMFTEDVRDKEIQLQEPRVLPKIPNESKKAREGRCFGYMEHFMVRVEGAMNHIKNNPADYTMLPKGEKLVVEAEFRKLCDSPPTLWIEDLKTPGNYVALAIFVCSTGSLLYDALFPARPNPEAWAMWFADQRRQKKLSFGVAQDTEPMQQLDVGSTKGPDNTRNVAARAVTYLLDHKRAIASIASGTYLAGNVVQALIPVFFPNKKK